MLFCIFSSTSGRAPAPSEVLETLGGLPGGGDRGGSMTVRRTPMMRLRTSSSVFNGKIYRYTGTLQEHNLTRWHDRSCAILVAPMLQ